ncbi:MAG TPA: hypothetical protein VE693_05545 [Gaiellaceae bacterium]|nr:hypothetical protein [Gaiellaceae bacterium]
MIEFADGGLHGTSTEDIARREGVFRNRRRETSAFHARQCNVR